MVRLHFVVEDEISTNQCTLDISKWLLKCFSVYFSSMHHTTPASPDIEKETTCNVRLPHIVDDQGYVSYEQVWFYAGVKSDLRQNSCRVFSRARWLYYPMAFLHFVS